MVNLVLCGGAGSRLWPVSREQHPKQFCKFHGEYTLLQDTLLRNRGLCERTVVMVNEQHYSLAKTQIEELCSEHNICNIEFILEPIGRNTAPAITIACLAANKDDIVFVTPSDHYIADGKKYVEAINTAHLLAEKNFLVTFGVKPFYPETGYGYIEVTGEDVISFKEKPDEKTAREYIEKGNHFWNSGMFVLKAEAYLDEIKRYSSDIYTASKKAFENSETKKGLIKTHSSYMKEIPADSIDYAVMEKSKKIKMIDLNAEWSDLGSFESIYNISNHDKDGNVSPLQNIISGSKGNFIFPNNRSITLIDVNDLIVIDTADALLISKRGSSHKIKELIPELEKKSTSKTNSTAIWRDQC